MTQKEDHPAKKHVTISVTPETCLRLKSLAVENDSNVSRLITNWAWEQSDVPYKSKNLVLSPDTFYHLESWAMEHHTTPDQAVTDMIWKLKVKDQQLRGQMSLF